MAGLSLWGRGLCSHPFSKTVSSGGEAATAEAMPPVTNLWESPSTLTP